MGMLSVCLVALSLGHLASRSDAEVLKVGGPMQSSGVGYNGKVAFEKWAVWANTASNNQTYTVALSWGSSGDIANVVANFTNPNHAMLVHVLVCPYGSAGSITALGAINAAFTGSVLVWGGASDSIFTTHCASHNCIGTFTVATSYMATGLTLLDTQSTDTLTVGLVENNNAFSASVCDGANATITAAAGLQVHSSYSLTQRSYNATAGSADAGSVANLISAAPDVVVICGHNGFVEPVINLIGASAYRPKAILGTNTITSTAQAAYGTTFDDCVMMPTQWDETATAVDNITRLNNTGFKALFAGSDASPTYHAASAFAAGIVLTHAMNAGAALTVANSLSTRMRAVNTPSFYGTLSFDSRGRIGKPMYTQQHQSDGNVHQNVVVAPAASMPSGSSFSYPLQTCSSWASGSASNSNNSGSGSVDAANFLQYPMPALLVAAMALFSRQ